MRLNLYNVGLVKNELTLFYFMITMKHHSMLIFEIVPTSLYKYMCASEMLQPKKQYKCELSIKPSVTTMKPVNVETGMFSTSIFKVKQIRVAVLIYQVYINTYPDFFQYSKHLQEKRQR